MSGVRDLIERLYEERPRLGHLLSGMRLKQDLVARIGVEAAFPIAQVELDVPGLDLLRQRAIRPLHEVARSEGKACHTLWEGGREHLVAAPRVIGEGDHAALRVVDRSAYLACVDDVTLRGHSSIVLRGDDALFDIERDEYRPRDDGPEFDPGVLKATRDRAWTMEPGADAPRLPQALKLCGPYAGMFGHWLSDFLPKLAMARLAGWTGGMPVIVDSKMPGTLRAALPKLLPADAPLVTLPHLAPMRVDRLWCMPAPIYTGFFPNDDTQLEDQARWVPAPQRLATLMREVGAMTSPATALPTGISRLYLGRKPQRQKRLLNDDQIRAVLDRHGFHCVFPEDLGFLEQVRLVRHARFIVAPEGSNASLSLLASPGARLCLLSPPATYRLGADCATFAALGIDATIVTGPSATESANHTDNALWSFWNDYRIDAAAFDDFLGAWLGGQ